MLALLPWLLAALMGAGTVIPYIIAVHRGDVVSLLPFISDTGALQPESCWFSFFFFLSAFVAMLVMYVRYKECEKYGQYDSQILRHNKISLIFGGISNFGLVVVASFQDKSQFQIHSSGAAMLFLAGIAYGFWQAWLSYKLSLPLYRLRAILMVLCLAILIVGLGCLFTAMSKLPKIDQIHNCTVIVSDNDSSRPWVGYWPSCLPGYDLHVVASVCEWTVGTLFALFFCLFYSDFKRISVSVVVDSSSFSINEPLMQ